MEQTQTNGGEKPERTYEPEGYAEEEKPESSSLVSDSTMLAILNKSEIDTQIATAKRYPRSIKRFRDEALEMVTLTEKIAGECIYALPRDGKVIEGPSARFAEIAASAWGNCRAGARVIAEDTEFVVAQGAFLDLERNTAIQYEVRRRITDKHGRRYKPDMIGVTANAACSIALRNAILKGIPKAFWTDIYDAARKTIMGDVVTLANRRAKALTAFLGYGISEEMICRKLAVAGKEDIGLEHLVLLQGIYTAIKEGEITPETAFAAEENGAQQATESNQQQLRERIEQKRRGRPPKESASGPPAGSTQAEAAPGAQTEISAPASQQGGEAASRLAHNQETAGANPAPAPNFPPTHQPERGAPRSNARVPGDRMEYAEADVLDKKEWLAHYCGLSVMEISQYVDRNLRGVQQTPERVMRELFIMDKLPAAKLRETIVKANANEPVRLAL